jgi:hypothetical protein
MRSLGTALLILGILLGSSIGIGMLLGVTVPGVSWLVAVGLTKLTLIASGGLIAAGALLQRLAKRGEDRARLEG